MRVSAFSASMAMLSMAAVAATAPTAITGRWLTQDKDAVIEIAPCGAALCGKVLRYLKPPKVATDVKNPDPAKRSRSLVVANLLTGMKPDGDRWRGQVYNPEDGKTYKLFVTRTGAGLDVKGCWGPFCQTQKWTPAK